MDLTHVKKALKEAWGLKRRVKRPEDPATHRNPIQRSEAVSMAENQLGKGYGVNCVLDPPPCQKVPPGTGFELDLDRNNVFHDPTIRRSRRTLHQVP